MRDITTVKAYHHRKPTAHVIGTLTFLAYAAVWTQRFRRLTATVLIASSLAVPFAEGAQLQSATRPALASRLPRQMSLDRLLAFAEQCVREAQAQRSRSDLSPIERIAAATRASGRLMQTYGKTVWLDGRVREIHKRGRVRFTPPPTAQAFPSRRPITTTGPAEITLAIQDVLIDHDDDHLVVLQMTPERAARVEPGKTYHFTARIVRLRRMGEGRWEAWLRHSRVPRRIDGWIPQGGKPDYREGMAMPSPRRIGQRNR